MKTAKRRPVPAFRCTWLVASALCAMAACTSEQPGREPAHAQTDSASRASPLGLDGAPMASTTATMQCGDVQVSVEFRDPDRVRVTIQREEIGMVHVPAASGAKYQVDTDSSTFFWLHGERALVQVGGKRYPECVQATQPHPPFTATGNEPGWRLELSDSAMVFVADYGETRVVMPPVDPANTETGRRYESRSDARGLVVTVFDEPCSDDMTGMPFPARVIIEFDGRTLRGCGGEPSALIEGSEWIVETLEGEAVIDGARVTMTFGGGRVAGGASCNEYSAGYTLTGEGLHVVQPTVTRRACVDSIMRQEAVFLGLLANLSRFSIENDGALTLHGADGRTIRARR